MAEKEELFTHQEMMAKANETPHEKFARETYNAAGKHIEEMQKAASAIGKTDKPIKKDRGSDSPLGGKAK